jgi:hypothetical protein
LFDSVSEKTPALVCRWDPRLSVYDFEYIAKHHEISDDLQFALASALFICLKKEQILDFLQGFHSQFDRLFRCLVQFCAPSSHLPQFLLPVFESHYVSHCDDVYVVFALLAYYLTRNEPEKCEKFLFLVSSLLDRLPEAGISLAKYFLAEVAITSPWSH